MRMLSVASTALLLAGCQTMSSPHVTRVAESYIGTNPTGQRSLWCADFVNLVVGRAGIQGTGSRAASSFSRWGHARPGQPQAGDVALVGGRRGISHVFIVESVNNEHICGIGGNQNRSTTRHCWPRSQIVGVRHAP